ncbi:hypothetical protein GLV94_05645 [Virgibacillus halodenitrificans]|uniref:TIGR02328 family protein n=1 Tax=Virgibacillus halodenitrificans TaxID=1482 RepID=UPI00136C661C|nr:TIGR02328 family protein [Virgibacillus halodenitrificans]MYL45120.1 hypothetical protein [Virgibacillus halodenitrificans]MYL58663.1 hypothetical protein [Virgibacillus halodenitrificans]
MRLWHEDLITYLPRQQLLGQHRECCALRGNGWGKKHSTVNYVFNYSPYLLYNYHMKIITEMKNRGYQIDRLWEHPAYRGKSCSPYDVTEIKEQHQTASSPIYCEHNQKYLQECIENLKEKGIELDFS